MCPSLSSSSSRMGGQGGEPPPVYLLNCSVCKGEFNSREKWMEHLPLEGHQNLAREGLQKDVNIMRDSSLMIFTNCDLTVEGALRIIQYFGKDPAVWVTDFLWWEERPRFAVVQFESIKKAEEVLCKLEAFAGDIIQIGNQGIQVKGAFDLLDLEWKAILPDSNPEPVIPSKLSQKSSEQNDKLYRLTKSTLGEIEETSEINSGEDDDEEDDSINHVKLLFDLAEERQWKPPNFEFEEAKTTNKRTKYLCTVLLNGQVYKPHWFVGRAKNVNEAQQKSAKYCLQALNSKDDKNPKENTAEDQNSSGPIGTLRALSQKLYGKCPEFKYQKCGGGRYLCRVILNGITYKPSRITGKADTFDEAKLITAQFCIEKIEKEYGLSAQEYLSSSQSHLSDQFKMISKFVEIPDEKYKEISEIVGEFRAVLRKRVPSTQVIIFRNWYLKLRNSHADIDEPVIIYIYAEDEICQENGARATATAPPPPADNFTWIPGKLVQHAISQFNELFVRLEITFPHPDDPQETRLGCKFLHKPSGTSFVVANFKRTMVEVQCCRLVKYFCEFDPRIRPLLVLARYWMISNGIHWGEPQGPAKTAHQCLPEPHPLDWIILTFLMGEKYVPSLRSILERPHKVLLERSTDTDVGFFADRDFAQEWKREKCFKIESQQQFILASVQIFQNFLQFCCSQIFDQGGVIINPKDGEVLETREFLSGDFTSKLTQEEISVLKQFQENSDKRVKGKYCVDFKEWNWYMINPLITNWRCSVPARHQELSTINATKKTNERLKKLLKLVESEGAEKAFEICGASLCEILKVDKEIPDIDPVPSRASRKRPVESLENEPEDEDVGPSTSKRMKIKKSQPGPALVTFDLEKSVPPPLKGDEISLVYQLYSLLEESVVIPDNQFDKVLQVVNFLKKVFFHSNDPTCKVSLFRSWNLKLKHLQNDPDDMPLVYVYNRKPCEETDSGFTLLPSGKIWSILKSREMKKKINVLEGPTPKGKDPSTFKKGWTLECKRFGQKADGKEVMFKICLFSSHKFIFEVEIDGLLEYMCKFDGRAYQMIKLAYLWVGLNGLTLGEEDNGLSGLQWLVIFWMCHRKMVPSPKEIQGRGNHKVMRDGGTGVDLGWEEDTEFLEEWREGKEEFEWRENCVENLLEGFREFLEFCGWLGEGSGTSWILNTKNGELIEMKKFVHDDLGDTSMSEEEIKILRAQLPNVKGCRVYMTHPFNLQWRFGLRKDIEVVLKLMKAGGIRLKKYLNVRKSNGEKAAKKRFKSFTNVFTLTDVDFNKVKHN